MYLLLQTPFSLAALIVRVALGVVMFPHGAQQVLGSMGVIVGFHTRIAAFGIACTVIVAALMVHWQFGFFLNWFGEKRGNGIEYHILALGMALSLIVVGGGMLSLDRFILQQLAPTTIKESAIPN